MDKITFESVMEEIKKSLGEARLMDIEEAMSDMMQSDIGSGPGGMDAPKVKKQEEPKPPQDNSKAGMMTRDLQSGPGGMDAPKPAAPKPEEPKPPQDNSKAGMMQRELGAGTGGMGTPTAKATTTAPGTQAPTTTSAPAAKTQAAPKAPSAPRASAPAAVDPHAKSKAMFGAATGDNDTSANFFAADAQRQKELAGLKSTPSAPAAKAPSAPSAPRPQVSGASAPSASAARPTVSAPRPVSQGSAAQATPKSTPSSPLSSLSSSGQAMAKQYSGKVGTDSSGNTPTDEPTSASKNYTPVTPAMKSGFRDALYRRSDKNTTTTNNLPYNPSKPSTTVTRPAAMQENFDQFVKKFLKESR